MSTSLEAIYARARQNNRHIVLPEGGDDRIVEGALLAAQAGLGRCTLLGSPEEIHKKRVAFGGNEGDFSIIDPASSSKMEEFTSAYLTVRAHKNISPKAASKFMSKPLAFGAMMVRKGDADGSVAGAVSTTSETIQVALQIIGPAKKTPLVSSFFLMILDKPHHPKQGSFIFSDAGMVVEPDAEALTQIAISSAQSFKNLVNEEPRVAMLSFSTLGSGKGAVPTKMQEATLKLRKMMPSLKVSGDLQFDAAFVPSVAHKKAPNEVIQGDANIFIFPDLASGNIGYKIAERIGGATAIGPILQGLAKPANDLSRGCSAQNVCDMIAITAVQ